MWFKLLEHRIRLWRSSAWNRGHKSGYELAVKNSDRDLAWAKRLEGYYYSHINDCIKTKHKCGEQDG